jgi:hypothetical protein
MEYIQKCVAKGIMKGTSATTMDPNGTLSRQMYFVMFARAMGIAEETSQDVKISDASGVADWAIGSVQALVNHGYIKGTSTNADGSVTVEANNDLQRCASVSLLSQAIGTYVKTDGDVEVKDEGIVLVIAKDVNIKSDIPITVVVAEPEATVSLKETTAEVNVIVTEDKVEVADAPEGTTVTTGETVTETVVNDNEVSKDTTEVVTHVHTYDNGVVTKAATCSATGIKTYTCQGDSSHTYTEVIPKVAHKWNAGVVTKAATCTTKGVKTYTCSVGKETKTEDIAATGHTWDAGVITKAATCTEKGVKTYTCKTCKTTKTESIAIVDHQWDDGAITTPATCTSTGVLTYTCAAGKETKTEVIPKAVHVLLDNGTCTTCSNVYKVYTKMTVDDAETITASVNSDYELTAYIPTITSMTKVEGVIQLRGISALGANGTKDKDISKTFSSAKTVDLSNVYNFQGISINIAANSNACTYTLSAAQDGTITGQPSSVSDAQGVWQEIIKGLGTDGLSLSGLKNRISSFPTKTTEDGIDCLTIKLDNDTKTIAFEGNSAVITQIYYFCCDVATTSMDASDVLSYTNAIAGAMNDSGAALNIFYSED